MRIMKPGTSTKAPVEQGNTQQNKHAEQPRAVKTTTTDPASWPGMALCDDPITAQVLMFAWSGDSVIVKSPPGSGKTRLTVLLADALSGRAGLRVGIAAQTRAQATDIARRLGELDNKERVSLIWTKNGARPDSGNTPVLFGSWANWPSQGGGVRIATTAKWLRCQPQTVAADVLIVDEAYQATYADLGALGAMAAQVVCVGDPGQIDPVVTGDTAKWVHNPVGPQRPGPAALAIAHADVVSTVALPNTWRLGQQTTAFVQPLFYPDLPFTSRRPPEHLEINGRVLAELAHRQIAVTDGPTDLGLIDAVVARVRELLSRTTYVTSSGARALSEQDVAVVVPHVNQAAAVRAMLADHPDVLCGTANSLQGQERAAVVAVHPMAGRRSVEQFALDTGRLCVMLSRHRSHLSLLVDEQTDSVLNAAANDGESVGLARQVLDQITATHRF
ncbi:recombinase B [Mycobacteroides abscessus subsp. massiliense]|nr:recombinase B [Mycobacteroides abscessus subsp. massiliense]